MKAIFYIFIGGGMGSVLRYFISQMTWISSAKIPFATLIANIISAFILGMSIKWCTANPSQEELKWFVIIGFCGGLSTFSTFTSENISFIQQGDILKLLSYIFLSVVICIISFLLGAKI